MVVHIFSHPTRATIAHRELVDLLHHVASETETSDLVVALYLLPGPHLARGSAFVREWLSPDRFLASRGFWRCGIPYGSPSFLPCRFKLIRMRLDLDPAHYPRRERDIYGWEFFYPTNRDHLALLFAHELHHFRRHHLGLHPREGEHGANRWALGWIHRLGYQAEGKRVIQPRRRRSPRHPKAPPSIFHLLEPGTWVKIRHDPRGDYVGETAVVVRRFRRGSARVVIATSDGRHWRWPIAWLEFGDNSRVERELLHD